MIKLLIVLFIFGFTSGFVLALVQNESKDEIIFAEPSTPKFAEKMASYKEVVFPPLQSSSANIVSPFSIDEIIHSENIIHSITNSRMDQDLFDDLVLFVSELGEKKFYNTSVYIYLKNNRFDFVRDELNNK